MRIFIVLLSVVFMLGYGCKKETPPPKKVVKPAKVAEVKPREAPPVVKEESKPEEKKVYTYDPRGKRDPFVPLITIKPKKVGTSRGTLESYDMSDFRLVAVAGEEGEYYALLLAPDGRAFTVREGTTIGLHNGKVRKILENKVIMIEYIKDYKGVLKPREVVLELRKGEE